MGRIKKLEMFGFKSFYSKTTLEFPPGLTIIMGPNGSGKSNILEALCFVLGKSSKKELRAERLGDFVFKGGKKLPPAKFAKVSIILNNKDRLFPIDEDEVKITRVVDKEGRSIFRVNGKRQPREYIRNLLAKGGINPDGYNIVLQGEIERFVDLSPSERREIIDDLAGISIYEEKKRKSFLELQKVDNKLKEVRIVLAEKKKHMEELEKEKEEAERYKEAERKLREWKAKKLIKEKEDLEGKKEELNKKIEELEKEITELLEKRQKISERISETEKEIEKINEELGEKGESERNALSRQIEVLNSEIKENELLINNAKKEIKRIEERLKQISEENKEGEKTIEEKRKKLEASEKNIEEINKKLEELEKKYETLNNLEKEKFSLLSKLSEIKSEKGKIESIVNEFDKTLKQRKELEELKGELKKKLSENSKLARELGELEEKKKSIEKEINMLEGKKEVMLRLLNKGVQAIINNKEKLGGIVGLVSELGKVRKEYALALKVAAGSRADAIVVNSVDDAKRCIEFLRESKSGVATFLPLDKIKADVEIDLSLKKEGAIDFAINLIEFDKRYEEIFKYVFGNTLVVKDIESAKKIGIGKIRMVTLKGDLIEKSGALTGGHRKESLGFDMEPLNEKIKALKEELSEVENKLLSLREKYEESSEICSNLRSKVYSYEEILGDLKDYKGSDLEGFKKKLKELEEKEKELEDMIKKLPEKRDENEIKNINEEIKKLREIKSDLEAQKKSISFEIEIISRDSEKLKSIKKELEKEKERFEEEIKEKEKELERKKEILQEKLKAIKKFQGKMKELFEKREKLFERIKKDEDSKEEIYRNIEEIKSKIQTLKLRIAELSAKIEGKNAALEEFSDLEISEVKEDIEEIKKNIENYEGLIRKFGAVNMRALEIFDQIKKEYEEIKEKYDKLESEKNEILRVIDELDSKKKEIFMKTFKEIAKNFSKLFAVLSPGGSAELILENEENPFEGGIDIIARPRGKKALGLRAMSGGEKTITTLAFIFAIQEYNPSPFYIMDEVDAALDRENSEMLAKLLIEYSKKSQFIVISHNDSIIAEADNLYGVHLNEMGESQVVSLKLPKR